MKIVRFFSELIKYSNAKFIHWFCWNGKLWLRPTHSSGYWLLCTVHDKRCQRQRFEKYVYKISFIFWTWSFACINLVAIVFVFSVHCSLYDIFYGFPVNKATTDVYNGVTGLCIKMLFVHRSSFFVLRGQYLC